MSDDTFMLAIGVVLGGLSNPDNFEYLVQSLRKHHLHPEYVVRVRDELSRALRTSGTDAKESKDE